MAGESDNTMGKRTVTQHWTDRARKRLLGRKIVEVRYLTNEEAMALGWYNRCVVLVLDNGAMFFPSADDEGNGAGALFGQDPQGGDLSLPVLSTGPEQSYG